MTCAVFHNKNTDMALTWCLQDREIMADVGTALSSPNISGVIEAQLRQSGAVKWVTWALFHKSAGHHTDKLFKIHLSVPI